VKEVHSVFNKEVSASYIRKIRQNNGSFNYNCVLNYIILYIILDYVYRRTRGSPQLTNSNKLQRYIWCKNNSKNTFSNYLFVDESTVRMLEVPSYHSRKKESKPNTVPHTGKAKIKVNIWGGISYNGPTHFAVS
jgi:hypothetical protein